MTTSSVRFGFCPLCVTAAAVGGTALVGTWIATRQQGPADASAEPKPSADPTALTQDVFEKQSKTPPKTE